MLGHKTSYWRKLDQKCLTDHRQTLPSLESCCLHGWVAKSKCREALRRGCSLVKSWSFTHLSQLHTGYQLLPYKAVLASCTVISCLPSSHCKAMVIISNTFTWSVQPLNNQYRWESGAQITNPAYKTDPPGKISSGFSGVWRVFETSPGVPKIIAGGALQILRNLIRILDPDEFQESSFQTSSNSK